MKVLVVGGGGREHAICWKLSASTKVDQIFCTPGNGGTANCSKTKNVAIDAMDFAQLISFSHGEKIDLVVIGPDNPLAGGIVDAMEEAGLTVFGPTKAQAKLEWSKAYAKDVLTKLNITTAQFAVASSQQTAEAIVKANSWARVIKVDGLALGKGVFVCDDQEACLEALDIVFKSGKFSDKKVVIEEKLIGEEISLLTLCDGKTIVPLLPCQDHKRRFDDDRGPNTGGMGAYAPVQLYERNKAAIENKILVPLQKALSEGKFSFKGVLYIGILMHQDQTKKDKLEPYVLEFNARFGDPETQTILPLLQSDLYDALYACTNGTLAPNQMQWSKQAACCVIAAARDYPQSSSKGEMLQLPQTTDSTLIFHAGTKLTDDGQLVTDGGRIFAAVGIAENMAAARKNAYKFLSQLQNENINYRSDIAKRETWQSK